MVKGGRHGVAAFVLVMVLWGVICGEVLTAEGADYDIAGRWLMAGEGFGEKSVRIRLSLNGALDIHTGVVGGQRCITSNDLNIRINASKWGIKAWEKRYSEALPIPVPLPELRPTLSSPFTFPEVRTENGLIYRVTLNSVTSGTVKIYGMIDLDIVGRTEINSTSDIWKEGTPRPEQKEDLLSGCSFGLWPILALAPLAWGLGRRRRP